MTVNEYSRARQSTWIHAHTVTRVHLYQNKASPMGSVTVQVRTQLLEVRFLDLQDVFDVLAEDLRLTSGNVCFDQQHAFELVIAWWHNRSSLVDVSRVNQVEHRKPLRHQHAVHRVEAEAALAVQEVRDVRLLYTDQVCQFQPC